MMMALLLLPMVAVAQCIDFYDLDADYVKCEIGAYTARTGGSPWTEEKVDYGPSGGNAYKSRHTIHRSASEIDPRTTKNGTEPGLHTVPTGELASVRLGNWIDGRVEHKANEIGQAERITYTFTVNNDNKYILMRYAIVWQDPHNHTDLVPSFQMETFLGSTGNTLIPGLCYNFDYDSNGADGGHVGTWSTDCKICAYQRKGSSQGNYYYSYGGYRVEDCPETTWRHEDQVIEWYDWQTRLINLEGYVGQTVRLRFTSSDCGYVEHWGYSYFTLRCLEVNLYSPTCGGPTETRTFTAPEGLEYNWYKVNNNTKERIELLPESSHQLTVLNDGQLYECYIASPENASCHISLYAKAEPRLPLSEFDINKHEACVDTVFLIDNSGVSRDGETLIYPHEDVDQVTWNLGDGRTNVVYSPGSPITYATDGTYTITQTTKLTNGNCVNTSSKTVKVRGRETKHEGQEYDTICSGEVKTWYGQEYRKTGVYPYTIEHGAANGFCDSIVRLNLKVWDAPYRNDTIDKLEGKEIPYVWHQDGAPRNLYTSGVYWDSCSTVHGCDSVYRLVLNVRPKYLFDETATICEGESYPYHKNGITVHYTEPRVYYDSLLTKTYGNDSVYRLQLNVLPAYHFSETQQFCKGDTVEFHGERFWTDGPHTVSFKTAQNCDSTYTLVLQQLPTYLKDSFVTITDKQSPYVFGKSPERNCMASGIYYDSLKTVAGCDSVIRLHLTINPTYFYEDLPVTICQGEYYNFHDTLLQTSGTYQKRFKSQYGTDSIFQIMLTVKPKYETYIYANCLEGTEYDFFGEKYSTGGVKTYTFTSTETRCDSVIKLVLTFRPKYNFTIRDTICQGDTYHFHRNGVDRPLKDGGTYWDSCKTVYGYDSIYRLDLKVNPSYRIPESFTICQGDTLYRHGQIFTEAKTYTIPFTTTKGCDSTFVLTLNLNPAPVIHKYENICEGNYVMWGGVARYKGGTYADTLSTVSTGCDSIRILHLTVRPVQRVKIEQHFCDGESWIYKGKTYTTNAIFSDTVTGSNSCDSITTYDIYFHPVVRDTVKAKICSGQTYIFHGHAYTTGGFHPLTSQSAYHCDSTHVLDLTVNPKYDKDTTIILCHGESVSVFGKLYSTGGHYYDTLKTANGCGCDSVYEIYIDEREKFFDTKNESICKGDTLTWHGKKIATAGIYYDSLTSVITGCDSVYQLMVSMRFPSYKEINATILDIDHYDFNGRSLNVADVYRDTLLNAAGCDSIVQLTLTVKPTYNVTEYDTICQGTPYIWNGLQLDSTDTYTVTLQSIHHTDSVVTLGLTVYKPLIYNEPTVHISNKQTYTWHGTEYDHSGTYDFDTISLVTGCDSITRLHLVVHSTYRFEDTATICGNKFYSFHGNSYNTPGDYEFNPHTVYWGYDSIYTLHLNVNQTYLQKDTQHICEGDYYDFLGKPLYEGGYYIDTIQSPTTGCDSIFHLLLIKHPVNDLNETKSICKDHAIQWHNRILSDFGFYYDTIRSVVTGCDSLRYTLSLTIQEPFYQEETATICANQSHTWRGRSYSKAGVYYDSLVAHLPPYCDSVYCLKLSVNPTYEYTLYDTICEGDHFEFGGIYYSTGGFYTRSLKTAHTGCDSIIHLSLTVKPITRIEKPVHLCDGDYFDFHGEHHTTAGQYIDTTTSVLIGCDSITTFNVFFHPVNRDTLYAETCAGEPFKFYGHEVYTGGEHVFGGQSAYGCDSLHVLYLTVHPTYSNDTTVTLCSGDKVKVFNKWYDRGSTYYDTLHTYLHGCDSIYTIHVDEYSYENSHVDISMCKGDYYDWRGKRITEANTYRDTVFHSSGCNDVYELMVNVKQPGYREIAATISGASYYEMNSRIYRSTGIYYDTLQNASRNGCDSIVKLDLTVYPEYKDKQRAQICVGESYEFTRGTLLTESGFYVDTLTSILGTDSVVELVLTVYRPIFHESVVHISDRDIPYQWKGHDIYQSVEYAEYDSVYTSVVTGCDSIERLKLYVHPTYLKEEYVEICDDRRFDWHKYSGLNESGTYYDSLYTQTWNQDSIHVLHLTVSKTYRKDTTVHMCEGDVYPFGGEILNRGGHYHDTITTAAGCDSIFNLTLIKHPIYIEELHKTICEGDFFDWRGKRLSEGNIYEDTLPEQYGCDTIYRLYLNIHKEFYQEIPVHICEGDYYDFHGRQLNKTGIYWDSAFTTMHHCDSVYKLDLTVHHTVKIELYDTICGTEYVMFGRRAIYQGGTFTDSLLTPHGCDSIVTLHLAHFPVEYKHTDRAVCRGDSVAWTRDGGESIIIKTAGIYPDTLVSRISGCDSIVELQLVVNNTYYQELKEAICSNGYYDFHGKLLNQPGTYWDSLTTVRTGCDSIFRLQLTVNPAYEFENTVYMCDWQPYYFAGERITQTGTYYDNLNTRKGCDSIHILHAFVMPSRRDSTAEQLCLGDSYNFNGRTLTNDGIYRDTLDDPITRQCVISVVNLSFVAQSKLSYVQVENACADDGSFIIYNNYVGTRPTTYSLLFDERARAVGFADILDQPYAERIEAPIPQRDNTTYLRPDYYHATLLVDNSVCVPDSQSAQAVTLLVRYPSWIIEQNWNDVVALLNENYNGGYTFTAYEWIVNDVPTGNHLSYLYLPSTLGTGDEVSIMLTRPGDTYSVPSCPIVIYDKTPELVSEYPVMAHPTGIRGQIRIVAGTDGEYTLYTMTGELITTGTFKNGEQTYIQTHVADGCYLLRLSTPSHGVQTKKIKL